jgi:predicted nucleic acid-binding protein
VTFVDSNVLIDVLDGDPRWIGWSSAALADAAAERAPRINVVVVGELAPGYEALDELLAALAKFRICLEDLDSDSAFLAGRRFAAYRRSGSARNGSSLLPDFLIGAHALTLAAPLLTRDPRLYRRYFPELTLITPENDNG